MQVCWRRDFLQARKIVQAIDQFAECRCLVLVDVIQVRKLCRLERRQTHRLAEFFVPEQVQQQAVDVLQRSRIHVDPLTGDADRHFFRRTLFQPLLNQICDRNLAAVAECQVKAELKPVGVKIGEVDGQLGASRIKLITGVRIDYPTFLC